MNAKTCDIRLPQGVFTRNDLLAAAQETGPFGAGRLRNLIASLLENGRIARVGRGLYSAAADIPSRTWEASYSPAGSEVVRILGEQFPLMEFRVWELSWLNDFLNHLAGRNIVFACIENDGCSFAFEELAAAMPGRVLLKPTPEEMSRYGVDGGVAIVRLVSEAPKSPFDDHQAAIEQIAVDMVGDKLVRSLLPRTDYPEALRSMCERYALDQRSLLRYARRRNKEDQIRDLFHEAGIELIV